MLFLGAKGAQKTENEGAVKATQEKMTDKDIADALNATGAVISHCVEWLKRHKNISVTRQAVLKRIHKSPELQQAREDAETKILDLAEGKLIKAIRDEKLAAIIFYLKCKGKARGYIEKTEIAGEIETKPAKNPFSGMDTRELIEMVKNETPNERRKRLSSDVDADSGK